MELSPHSPICLHGVNMDNLTVCNVLLPSVKFRMSVAVPPLPHIPSWYAQGQLHSLLHLVTLSKGCGWSATCNLINPLRTDSHLDQQSSTLQCWGHTSDICPSFTAHYNQKTESKFTIRNTPIFRRIHKIAKSDY